MEARLDKLKQELKNKQATQDDFRQRYNIDFDILLDPKNPQFNEIYALQSDAEENMLMVIKIKSAQRATNICCAFGAYHITKHFLWKRNIGAQFFYRTKLMSIPLLFGALWYSTIKVYQRQLKEAEVYEYAKKSAKFQREMNMLKKFMANRQDYLIETKSYDQSTMNIQGLINK